MKAGGQAICLAAGAGNRYIIATDTHSQKGIGPERHFATR